MLQFHLVSLFPEFFTSPLACGLMARARERGIIGFSFHNPRDYSADRHRHVDDSPYGGGPGMVMRVEPVAGALAAIQEPGRMLLMTPGGRPFTARLARELAGENHITLVCGRYEGLDARLSSIFPLEPFSVGEAVLNGGEAAALAVIEAVARLRPGFMGKQASGEEESFSDNLLEYPQYTRPEVFAGRAVPRVLLSGDHAKIATWRRRQALAATLALRPDLLPDAPLSGKDAALLSSLPRERLGRNLSFCLLHYPVVVDGKKSGAASLTNLDIHDISRISASYGMGPFYVATPLPEQLALLRGILRHWRPEGPGGKTHPDRARALALVEPVASLAEAAARLAERCGARPRVIASSAGWPRGGVTPLTAGDMRRLLAEGPVLLCLGTARGLAETVFAACDGRLRPLRFLGYNHLSVRSAAAIYADRILGDLD